MKILITGAGGFIGHHLLKKLATQTEHEVHAVVRIKREEQFAYYDKMMGESYWVAELTDYHQIKNVMDAVKPDVVFHLAANPVVREDDENPTVITEDNVLATHNVLASCQPGTRFVFASSATVYGDPVQPHQIKGNGFVETDECRPTSVYAASKLTAEEYVKFYTRHKDIEGVILRLIANVGTGSTHGLIHDVFRKLKSDNPNLELLGDWPGSSKPYMHVEDTVRAMMKVMSAEEAIGEVYNVSPIGILSVETVANIAIATTGIVKPIEWLGEGANWKGDNRLVKVCGSKLYSTGFDNVLSSYNAVSRVFQQLMEEQ